MFSRPPRTKEEFDRFLARRASNSYEDYSPRETKENSRLNMIFPARVFGASVASFGVGTFLGMTQGSKMAGMRFRAEHAHKLPSTPTGWFMYHKSKNYNMAREGLKEGTRMGFRVCFWTTTMFFIENLYDDYRQSKDFVNTVLASLTVAGGFSLWSESTLGMPTNTALTALLTTVSGRRSTQPTHDRTNRQDCPRCWSRLRRSAGRCRCRQRSTHRLCRLGP